MATLHGRLDIPDLVPLYREFSEQPLISISDAQRKPLLTPVLTRSRGSVPELIEQGVTGFIFETVKEGIAAAREIPSIDRERCRDVFERRFTSRRMASDYLEAYLQLDADSLSHEVEIFETEAPEQETTIHL